MPLPNVRPQIANALRPLFDDPNVAFDDIADYLSIFSPEQVTEDPSLASNSPSHSPSISPDTIATSGPTPVAPGPAAANPPADDKKNETNHEGAAASARKGRISVREAVDMSGGDPEKAQAILDLQRSNPSYTPARGTQAILARAVERNAARAKYAEALAQGATQKEASAAAGPLPRIPSGRLRSFRRPRSGEVPPAIQDIQRRANVPGSEGDPAPVHTEAVRRADAILRERFGPEFGTNPNL